MKYREYILYFLLFSGVYFIHIDLFDYIFDDAYIHFRIAENFINYGLPYYNVDEAYMASSSPMWTIILASLYYLFDSNYLNVLIFFNSILLIINMDIYKTVIEKAITVKMTLLQLIAFSFIFIAVSLNASIGLMETNFAMFLVGLSLIYIQKDNAVAFFYLTLAIFTRLEIAILYLFFAAYFFRYNKKRTLSLIKYSVLGSFVFIIYDLYYFGTMIPMPVRAKSIVYDIDLWKTFAKQIFYGEIIALLLVIFLVVFFIIKKDKIKLTPLVIFSLSGITLWLAYIIKNVHLHAWYSPLYLVPITVGVFSYTLYKEKRLIYLIVIYVLLLPFFKPFFIDTAKRIASVVTQKRKYLPHFKSSARVRSYLDISKKLYNIYPNATLMTSEIGGIGYGFRGRIVDGMGLIQPTCLKYHPMKVPEERSNGSIGAIPIGCVEEKMPDLIVSYDVFIQSLSKSEILKNYVHYGFPTLVPEDLKETNDPRIWGSENLNVYIRSDIDRGI